MRGQWPAPAEWSAMVAATVMVMVIALVTVVALLATVVALAMVKGMALVTAAEEIVLERAMAKGKVPADRWCSCKGRFLRPDPDVMLSRR